MEKMKGVEIDKILIMIHCYQTVYIQPSKIPKDPLRRRDENEDRTSNEV